MKKTIDIKAKNEDICFGKINKNANSIVVYVSIIVLIIITGFFCALVYYNKLLPKQIDISAFTKNNDESLCRIINISENENYVLIEAEYLKDIKKYEIYIGVENVDGEMKFYKTQKESDKTFIANIKKNRIKEESQIVIAYMCDNEKVLINTNKIVGESNE